MNKLKLLINWIRAHGSGLSKLPQDVRDFKFYKLMGDGSYIPKHKELDLGCISVKDQKKFNTCVFNSSTEGHEEDEGIELSVRSVVAYAKRKGYISGNGYSNLRYGQQSLKDFGAMEAKGIQEDVSDWEQYSNLQLDFVEAAKHRIASFWSISSKNELYKALDDGRYVHLGMDWYNGFNQSGGFSKPWIITKKEGYNVGGHAVRARGYIMDFNNIKGLNVIKVQNSYSKLWGDDGCFYVEVNYLIKEMANYGAYVNLDISVDTGKFINKYDGKNVQLEGSPSIWFIQKGVKKPYPNWETFLAYRGKINWFETIKKGSEDAEALMKLPVGDNMDITKSYYYTFIMEDLKNSDDKDRTLWRKFDELYRKDTLGLLNIKE